jgi:hypothetical protein
VLKTKVRRAQLLLLCFWKGEGVGNPDCRIVGDLWDKRLREKMQEDGAIARKYVRWTGYCAKRWEIARKDIGRSLLHSIAE